MAERRRGLEGTRGVLREAKDLNVGLDTSHEAGYLLLWQPH